MGFRHIEACLLKGDPRTQSHARVEAPVHVKLNALHTSAVGVDPQEFAEALFFVLVFFKYKYILQARMEERAAHLQRPALNIGVVVQRGRIAE